MDEAEVEGEIPKIIEECKEVIPDLVFYAAQLKSGHTPQPLHVPDRQVAL